MLFLPRAKKCRLGRIPLQPWVEETTESTVEDRMRHNYQAEWGVDKDKHAGVGGGRTTVQTLSAAAKTLPTTPTRER